MENNKFFKILDEVQRHGRHFFYPIVFIGVGVWLGWGVFLAMTEIGPTVFCLLPLISFVLGLVLFFVQLGKLEEKSKDERYWWD